jgi:urease accessory protein
MTSARFAIIFSAIFFLGALPLVLVQSLGGASAGLSSGLVLPLSHPFHILTFFMIGMLASQLSTRSYALLPLAFLTMMALGGFLEMNHQTIPAAKFLILSAIILFGMIANHLSLVAFLFSTMLTASVGYSFGNHYALTIPDIADPLYYLLGILIATCFLLLGGLCLGLTVASFFPPLEWRKHLSVFTSHRQKKSGFEKLLKKPTNDIEQSTDSSTAIQESEHENPAVAKSL